MSKHHKTNWGAYAAVYRTLNLLRAYRNMVSDLLFALQLHEANRVADIGCGTGFVTKHLSTGTFDVVGIDGTPEMLEQAQVSCGSRTTFFSHDLATPLLKTFGQYDRILLSNVLYALNDPLPLMHSVFACMRPGGYLVISTPKKGFQLGEVLRFQAPTHQPAESWQDLHLDQDRLNQAVRAVFGDSPSLENLLSVAKHNVHILNDPAHQFYTRQEIEYVIRQQPWTTIEIATTYAKQNWLIIAKK